MTTAIWPMENGQQTSNKKHPDRFRIFSPVFVSSKTKGQERKGPPEIIQKFRLRNWSISSAAFPMTPMEGTERHFGPS